MLKTLAEKVDPRWTALLVIDVQNDYAHPEGATGRRGGNVESAVAMVPRLAKLVDAARQAGVLVVFTRNWHSEETDSEAWAERASRAKHRAGLANSWGADWYEIVPREGEPVISKSRYDAFLRTDLDDLLRERGIRTVICTGTATNVCVESTARSAHMRDYYVVLAEDCCAAPDPALHAATARNVERHFGVVASGADLAACWEQSAVSSQQSTVNSQQSAVSSQQSAVSQKAGE